MESDFCAVARPRRKALRLLLVTVAAGATLAVGAAPGAAFTNSCNNGETISPGVPPTGEDFGVDVGPGVAFIGVDLELAEALAGRPGPIVCVNNDGYTVHVRTTGGVYFSVNHCTTPSSCPVVIGNTGVIGSLTLVNTTGSTTICAGVCTSVPFTPIMIDTGYDVYVNDTKVANICVSAGPTC